MLVGVAWGKERQLAHAQLNFPTWARNYAESANKLGMASSTHTRTLGTPPAQIRTYEEVSNGTTFQEPLKF